MADGDSRAYEDSCANDDDAGENKSASAAAQRAEKNALVWDLPVRLFHWSLVIAVIGAFVTNKLGVAYFNYHLWCGYAVLVLVAFRIVWGFIGTHHARFVNFVRGPKAIRRYLKGGGRRHAGHNPLGALMVIALLAGLLIQAVTGLFGNDEIFNVGPLYGFISNEWSLRLTSWHRQLFYWLAGAIGLHVIAIVFYRIARKEHLIKAMITGRKNGIDRAEAIETSSTLAAAAVVIVLSALLTFLVMHSPAAAIDAAY